MSQKVSPLLFNNYIYNNSKWFNKNIKKYSLNEDLQIREIINILFKNNVNTQYLFVDKIVIAKYFSHIQIYVYFYCNFNYFKRNLLRSQNFQSILYLNTFYLYYKYLEILNIKKIEILKILKNLVYKNNLIFLYFKNINFIYNSLNLTINKLSLVSNIQKVDSILFTNKFLNKNYLLLTKRKNFNNHKKSLKTTSNQYMHKKYLKKYSFFKINRFKTLYYFKTIYFLLYNLCYSNQFNFKLNVSSLINLIYYELDNLDNTSKNYNFLFYNMFNLIREILTQFFKTQNCQIRGIRIQVKGRYFLTKRKRIFIFNFGKLNLNNIHNFKDYACLNLIKSTGSSSIKIWINY